MPFAFSFQLLWHEMHSGPWEYELAFVSIEVYRLPRRGEGHSDVLVMYGLHQGPRSSTPWTSHFEVESDSKEIWRKGTRSKFYLSSGKNDFKKLKSSCLEIQFKSRAVKCLQAQHLAAWASVSGGLTTDAKGSQAELREHVFIQGVWAPFPWQTSYWRHKNIVAKPKSLSCPWEKAVSCSAKISVSSGNPWTLHDSRQPGRWRIYWGNRLASPGCWLAAGLQDPEWPWSSCVLHQKMI